MIPVGISDFEEIREKGYYYIDKSGLITDILKNEATKVTLITRPRRFGKTMAMSMLASFLILKNLVHVLVLRTIEKFSIQASFTSNITVGIIYSIVVTLISLIITLCVKRIPVVGKFI